MSSEPLRGDGDAGDRAIDDAIAAMRRSENEIVAGDGRDLHVQVAILIELQAILAEQRAIRRLLEEAAAR